jgi:hypothetical protein
MKRFLSVIGAFLGAGGKSIFKAMVFLIAVLGVPFVIDVLGNAEGFTHAVGVRPADPDAPNFRWAYILLFLMWLPCILGAQKLFEIYDDWEKSRHTKHEKAPKL